MSAVLLSRVRYSRAQPFAVQVSPISHSHTLTLLLLLCPHHAQCSCSLLKQVLKECKCGYIHVNTAIRTRSMSDQAEGARAASPVAICSAQNAGNLATSVDHAASATGVGDGELILLNFYGTAVCFATTRWRLYRRVCYWQP